MNESDGKQNRAGTRIRKFLILVLVMGVLTAAGASLQVEQVTFEGNVHYTDAELEEVLLPEGEMRNPVYFLLMTLLRQIPEIPFVSGIRAWPTGLTSLRVQVFEKKLAGAMENGGKWLYFDYDGIVAEQSDRRLADVPVFSGLTEESVEAGEAIPLENSFILEEIINVSQFLTGQSTEWGGSQVALVKLVDEVRLDDRGNVTVQLGDIAVYLGNKRYMEDKLLTMKDILPRLYGRSGTLRLDNYDPNAENPGYVFK